ncbi:MAG TPA: TraR/DksA C4-type zinc finger protein [Gemmatimonadaceae bacterium]|nr:TraR/DksA C4-type zinc finger protein [Gemmatimonadaceae bacterium]
MATRRARPATGARARSPRTSGAPTRAQLRALEAELLAERRRLERSMGAAAPATRVDALVGARFGSVPEGDPDDALRLALHGRVHARYEAVSAALQRLVDGTYGRCGGCGEFIPFGRLLVMPESERCMACGPLA